MHYIFCPQCGNKLTERVAGDDGATPYCDKCNILKAEVIRIRLYGSRRDRRRMRTKGDKGRIGNRDLPSGIIRHVLVGRKRSAYSFICRLCQGNTIQSFTGNKRGTLDIGFTD